jgi:prepilin-type N-terminal cleavage/methylation domain-containing protein
MGMSRFDARRPRANEGFTLLEIMVVVGIAGVIAAFALPQMSRAIGSMRLSGDARSVSNMIALAKTRAASNFSKARVYVNLGGKSFRLESWNATTNQWVIEGGTATLGTNVSFGFGAVATPPANTQPAIAQAPLCTDNAGTNVGGTACIMFNSRGIPIDATISPTAADALYLTDGTAVYGVTVAASGLIGTWRTAPTATPSWRLS